MGQRPVLPVDICLVSVEDICLFSTADIVPVSTADICPVPAADICPVSTADICPVATEDIWLVWVHLGGTKMISTPFLHLKCAKWSTPGGEGGEGGAPEMQPHAAARG